MKRKILKPPKKPDSFSRSKSSEIIKNLNLKYHKSLSRLAKTTKGDF